MKGVVDYYIMLGLSPYASTEEIKQSFRRLAQIHHPDKNNDSIDSKLYFRSILEAYNVLSSAEGRQRYDDYLRTSIIINKKTKTKKQRAGVEKNPDIDQIVNDVKSQLNFILWEIEDLLKHLKTETLNSKLGEQTIEEIIIYILAFYDKWILNPAGFGDYFYTARQIDIKMEYNPFNIAANHAHRPYVDRADYFFQLRRRFDKFLNGLKKSDLSTVVNDTGVSLFDCIFEAVNLSFHYLGFINRKINDEEMNFSRYLFSNRIFDDNDIKYLNHQ